MTSDQEWLTTEDLSARWRGHVSQKTLTNLRHVGKGPTWTKLGKRVLYRLSDVQVWERSNTIHPE